MHRMTLISDARRSGTRMSTEWAGRAPPPQRAADDRRRRRTGRRLRTAPGRGHGRPRPACRDRQPSAWSAPRICSAVVVDPGRSGVVRRRRQPSAPASLARRPGRREQPRGRPAGGPQRPPRVGGQVELERGRPLPVLDGIADACAQGLTVYDGRLDHGVPTVVVVGDDFVRWGSGSTLTSAYQRALYGDRGTVGTTLSSRTSDGCSASRGSTSWPSISAPRSSARPACALLGAAHGPSHDPGRSWDADPVN